MTKIKRKYITYYMPGSFMPETSTNQVSSFAIPKEIPRDVYGFQFTETEYVIDGKKEYEGDTKTEKEFHLIGMAIPASLIPDDDNNRILKSNITNNSPTQEGVKTHLGNWQIRDKNNVVHDPKIFTFVTPLIYKNIKSDAA